MTGPSERTLEPEVAADRASVDLVRAAWLYYVGQATQSEIADALGLTRFRVNRMLADCRAEGLVRVEITSPLAPCVELERRAIDAFGLTDAVIVPAPLSPGRLKPMIGAGLAGYLSTKLEDRDMSALGVGWGGTMREMIRHLKPTERPDLSIVTLLGALPRASEENSIEIISRLRRMLSAQCHYMTAPIYADTPEARYVLTAQPFYEEVLDRILAADIACFAVGDMTDDSLILRYALPKGITTDDLLEAGAVGDVLGIFLDAAGSPVDHPVNRQIIGPGLDDLKHMRSLVLASGGPGKVAIMTAALKAGVIDVLVTDQDTILALLADHAEVDSTDVQFNEQVLSRKVLK